jgi:acetyl-CoA acetyltransferase
LTRESKTYTVFKNGLIDEEMFMTEQAAIIAGIGQTDFSKASGRSVQQLALEAAFAAIADAGLTPGDIDGLMPYKIGPTSEDLIAGLGLTDVRFTNVSHMGGASPVASLRTAALAVNAGIANAVMVFVARNGRSGARVAARLGAQVPGTSLREGLEQPEGFSTPAQWYALFARRHMIEYGTTREQLGTVAITMRNHALLNPEAMMYGKPLTMEEYASSKPIADPYLMFDCCLETDGACAVIVTRADRAAGLPNKAVTIAGVAEGHADDADDIVNRRDFFNLGLSKAAPRAFAAAGLTPSDVDLALVYDCFTFEVIQQLEEAGFAARGEGGAFVQDGHIALGGSLPVNPHGGLLSQGHIAGINHIVEAVVQLRGTAGARQVEGARVAAVTGWGDLGDGSLAVLTV